MSTSAQVVPSVILRLSAVIAMTGMSRSSIYAGIADGTFPKQIKLGARSMGFIQAEVNAWIENRIASSRA